VGVERISMAKPLFRSVDHRDGQFRSGVEGARVLSQFSNIAAPSNGMQRTRGGMQVASGVNLSYISLCMQTDGNILGVITWHLQKVHSWDRNSLGVPLPVRAGGWGMMRTRYAGRGRAQHRETGW
jgi:hypothetical protein